MRMATLKPDGEALDGICTLTCILLCRCCSKGGTGHKLQPHTHTASAHPPCPCTRPFAMLSAVLTLT